MEFLDGPAAKDKIVEYAAEPGQKRFAVAFWGKGAAAELGLKKGSDVRVICNLLSGGTNPVAIKELQDLKIDVRHSTNLHAKVYMFRDRVIVGSSNASTNGLGEEHGSWSEANILTDSPAVLTTINDWFEQSWTNAKPVEPADLKRAAELWNQRPPKPPSDIDANDLLEALGRDPGQFRNENVHLLIFRDPLDPDIKEALDDIRERRQDPNISALQDWDDLPPDGTFVSFKIGKRGGVYFDGVFHFPRSSQHLKVKKSTMQVCNRYPIPNGDIPYELGAIEDWKSILPSLRPLLAEDDGTLLMDLAEFGEIYVKPWYDARRGLKSQ